MSCPGCTRRAVLHGIGAAIAVGCGGSDLPAIDAPSGVPCGANQVCLDVTMAPYTALANVGGIVRIMIAGALVIVIRADATTVDALSDICTHAGCTLGYNSSIMLITCPCHGSQFELTGAVHRGPAIRALAVYPAMFDAATNIVTITTG